MPVPASWSAPLLSVLRIIAGLGFMQHGTMKFFNLPPAPGGMRLDTLTTAAGVLELAGGALIVLGLLTRPVAFLLAGEMAVAYFLYHAPNGWMPLANGGEGAMLYCFLFLYFAAAGAGPWSLDALRKRG